MTTRSMLTILLLTLGTAVPGLADDPATGSSPEPDVEAMAEAWKAAAEPGDMHGRLADMVGQWDVRIRMWMAPGAEPQEARGMAHNHLILGGRFLQQDYKGSFLGEPFVGMGIEGYDSGRELYVSDWRDTMSLFVLRQEGRCDDDACTSLTYRGSWVDPLTGETHTTKSTVQHKSSQMTVIEMWDRVGDGEFVKNMEMIYTRR